MNAADFQEENSGSFDHSTPPSEGKKRISWEDFQREYLTREDEYCYEWLDGAIEKTKRTMNYTQFYILRNIQRFFRNLLFNKKVHGELIPEGDIFFGKHHRRPDVAWLSDEEIDKTALGENQVPLFIIEIISTNDQINHFSKKMQDYRAAGVQVVWEIRYEVGEVYVHTGEDLKNITLCTDNDLCSAAPVLPDFVMAVKDVLRMPEVEK